MTYFYRRAAALDVDADAEPFRYPGPRPQSRETALVMLADGCEATARASPDRSDERLRAIVEGTLRERLEEGQCDLRDLRVVAGTFIDTLHAAFHQRVEYPQPTARERAARAATPAPAQRRSRFAGGDGEDEAAPAPEPWPPSRRGTPPAGPPDDA
ncbi:MAG: hypothetical protein EXR65_01365 [Dehalococcoidia bacterium]|nr:hypothetical protein [Dehalococcoidia bacterium]